MIRLRYIGRWVSIVTMVFLATPAEYCLAEWEQSDNSPEDRSSPNFLSVRTIVPSSSESENDASYIKSISPKNKRPSRRLDGSNWSSLEAKGRPRDNGELGLTLTIGQNVAFYTSNFYAPGQGYANFPQGGMRPPGPFGGGGTGGGPMGGGRMHPGGGMGGGPMGGAMMGGDPMEGGMMGPMGGGMMGSPGGDPMGGGTMGDDPMADDPMGGGMMGPMGGGMGGGPMGGGMMVPTSFMGGPVGGMMGNQGTATNLSARLGYSPTQSFGLSLGVGGSIPEGTADGPMSSLGMPGGTSFGRSLNLSGMLSYASAKDFNLSLRAMSMFRDNESSEEGSFSPPSTSVSGGLNYAPTDSVRLYLTGMSIIPNGQSWDSNRPSGNSALVSPGSNPMTMVSTGVDYQATEAFSLGVGLTQLFNYSGIDDSFGVNGPRYPGYSYAGLGNEDLMPDTTVVSPHTAFALSRYVKLSANAPYGFQSGLYDPTAGIQANCPLMKERNESFFLMLGLFGTAPFSQRSQEEGKITTVTASLGPMYRYEVVSFNYRSQLSYSFYQDSYLYPQQMTGFSANSFPTASGSGTSRGVQLRTMNSVNLGLKLAKEWRTVSSASINFTSARDGSISWGTNAVPLGITYSPSPLSISASVSLTSDPMDDQAVTFPNRPAVGMSISYTFGNPRAGMAGMGGRPFPRRWDAPRESASTRRGVEDEQGVGLDD